MKNTDFKNSKYTLLTPKDAAPKLNMSLTSLYLLLKTDEQFPAIKVNNKWIIIEDKIPEWIDKKLENKGYI